MVKNNARYYLHLLTGQKEFVVGFLIVLLAWPSLLAIRWYLLFPALWGLFLYGLIHVEPRLVGVFFVIFWMPLFASLRVRSRSVVLLVTLLVVFATAFKVTKAQISAPRHATNMQWQAAAGLQRAGIAAQSRVAVFGHGNEGDYWAHMDGLRVVADIELGALPSYRSASPQVRSEIRTRLEALNVRAVICTVSPIEDGWQLIPGSTYYFRFLGPHGPDNSVQSPQSPPAAATQR